MNIFSFLKKSKPQEAENERTYQGLEFPLFCKVHAVKSPDHQGAIAQSRVGDHLLIVHTPTEERPCCVCVYSIPLNRVLGYLEEGLSEKLVTAFGEGFCRDCEVEQITGGTPYKYLGCNLRLMDTTYFLEDLDTPPLLQE